MWSALLMAIALGGNWGVSAFTARKNVSDYLEARQDLEGRIGQVGGFPHALRFTLSELRWHQPSDNLRWDLGNADVYIPLFHRGQIQISFPERQIAEISDRVFVLNSEDIRADLNLGPDNLVNSGRLDARQLRFEPVTPVQSVAALTVDLANLDGHNYRVFGIAEDIRLASDILQHDDAVGTTPISLSFDANLIFASSMAMDDAQPQLHGIEISAIELEWQPTALMLDGALVRNPEGLFDGRLNLTATHWQDLQDAMIRSGVLAPDLAPMISALIASQSDPTTGRLSVQLAVSNSAIRFGPFVIATLPSW